MANGSLEQREAHAAPLTGHCYRMPSRSPMPRAQASFPSCARRVARTTFLPDTDVIFPAFGLPLQLPGKGASAAPGCFSPDR